MKYELPDNHGLPAAIVKALVFHEGDGPALTDAQYASLQAGVGRRESALVVSPTSTGKTHIALWAIARGIVDQCNTVYLVTHRALAKQKFDEFKTVLVDQFLAGSRSSIVIATGDYVEDGEGNRPAEPLRVPLLIATYEKYLALLSASGIPADMTSTVVVCDEIQLIGDPTRGQNVEILLTLLRNAGWRQFVGLSAVLHSRDGRDLADWLGVTLVEQHVREKHLSYECWSAAGIAALSSERPETIHEGRPLPGGVALDAIAVTQHLLDQKAPPLPIIVFCTRSKQTTYDLAEALLATREKGHAGQLSLAFDDLPETSANGLLARALAYRIAVHNADLTEEERDVVERHLVERKVDVVFATPTLAAGVNFPFGAAVFASWTRWNPDRRAAVPIESAEFHNMAGRVGRMGFEHDEGRVIFLATSEAETRVGRGFLDLGSLPELEPRVATARFNQLALQLVSSGLCKTRGELETLVCTTFSGIREQDRNNASFAAWPRLIGEAVDDLVGQALLVEAGSGALVATPVGKAIAQSGFYPETGIFLLQYIVKHATSLTALLPSDSTLGNIDRLYFLLCCACFASPEFRPNRDRPPSRFLPWPLEKGFLIDGDSYRDQLPDPVWQADVSPVNASKLTLDWIGGADLRALEACLPQLSAGMLRDMHRNVVWALQGFATIVAAASDVRTPPISKPECVRVPVEQLNLLAKLPRVARRLGARIASGLPEDVLWMSSVGQQTDTFRLFRTEILALRANGLSTPQAAMVSSTEANQARLIAFAKIKPAPQAKANWLRDACRSWKIDQRNKASQRHTRRARQCASVGLVRRFYETRGADFENTFEAILAALGVAYARLDDKTKRGAPDYRVDLAESPSLIIELKSREGDRLVEYNGAVEVLAASEVHGHKSTFCVTLCHPGVDPSVPLTIAACGRLSVVETSDLGEALLRLCEGSLKQSQLYSWLASPGQALADDLPFREYD